MPCAARSHQNVIRCALVAYFQKDILVHQLRKVPPDSFLRNIGVKLVIIAIRDARLLLEPAQGGFLALIQTRALPARDIHRLDLETVGSSHERDLETVRGLGEAR